MSKYKVKPVSFDGLNTVSIYERPGKVQIRDFARPYTAGSGVDGLIASLPGLLAADELRFLAQQIQTARERNKPVLWGLGGHVVKCGLAPVMIDLMHRGFATGFLFNGSTSIHDFEIGLAGCTSEDVDSVLPGGQFGVSAETGLEMNHAIHNGAGEGIGMGEALGKHLRDVGLSENLPYSLLASAYSAGVPVTVHVAIGTDTPHMHPAVDPAALGVGTHHDFRVACSMIGELHDGGVYINAGSAVVLPEIFLKAVSLVRNLGNPLLNFTTATLDFLQHYRPRVNVVQRPHMQAGGRGVSLTGHHELLIPLLAATLIEGSRDS